MRYAVTAEASRGPGLPAHERVTKATWPASTCVGRLRGTRGREVAQARFTVGGFTALGDAAGGDVEDAVDGDGLEQPAVVGHQQQRALEVARAPARAARWRAGRGGSSARRAPGSSRRCAANRASTARVRSPGDSVPDGPLDVVGPEAELGQQRPGVGDGQARSPAQERRRAGDARRSSRSPGLVELADHDAGPEPALARRQREPAEQRAEQRGLARSRSGPTIATRSAQPISRSTGPSRKSPRSTTAPSSRATTSPLRGAVARSSRSSQPSHGLSTASSRSSGLLGRAWPSPPASRRWRCMWRLMYLSLSRGRLTARADALPRPLPLRAGPARGGRRRSVDVPAVGLLGVAAGRSPARRGRPASRPRNAWRGAVCSSSSRTLVTVRSRNARSWLTTTTPAPEVVDEALEPVEPVEVEVVGRLVEQEHVEAAEQDGRQPSAGRLPARQRRRSAGRARGRAGRGRPSTSPARASRSAPPRASQRRARRRSGRRRRGRRGRERMRSRPRARARRRPRRCAGPGTRRAVSPARRSGSWGR